MALKIAKHSDTIFIITHEGILDVDEHNESFKTVILPVCQKFAPDPVHVINDMRQMNMDFAVFVKLLDKMRARRTEALPDNLRQYMVGNNQWVQTIRDWIHKNDQKATAMFTSVDLALDYIDNL